MLVPLMSEECIINLLFKKVLTIQDREPSPCELVHSSSLKMSKRRKVLLWLLRRGSVLLGSLRGCELVALVSICFDEI